MIQKLAWVFGIVFILVGVLGFVPGVTSGGLLLGIFSVDTMHNSIHLLSGVLAILAAMGTGMYARLYFKVFGIIYALVTILGFVMGGEVLGMMMNMADNLLHLIIAVVALWAGFGMKEGGDMQSQTT
jgi:Domain of unknown function (DUF4383)